VTKDEGNDGRGVMQMDPLNPPPPASESKPKDAIKVENPIEHEDETVLLASMRDINSLFGRMDLCGSETAHALVEKKGKAKDEFYGKLILDLGNEVRSCVDQETDTMEKLVEKFGNAEDKVECKKLKKDLKKQDEDEDLKEDEFEEEEDPQKEEDDMEVDIKEDNNELELTYLIKRWTLLTLHRLLLSQNLRMRSR
nr:hypothetical protein [Tanacetum cinerariifolium]